MTPMRPHLGPPELVDLLEERGSAWDRDHVASCARCGDELKTLQAGRSLVADLARVPEPAAGFWAEFRTQLDERLDRRSERAWLPWLAAAAVLVATLGLVSELPRASLPELAGEPLEVELTGRLAILHALEPSDEDVAPWAGCPDGTCVIDLSDAEARALMGLLRAEMKQREADL